MIPMMAITPSKMDRKTLGLPTFFYTGFGLLEVSLNTEFSVHGKEYSIQHYVIKFVSDLRQVGGFTGTPVSSTNKTDRHLITEILLKVALNTIN
jgi:hypothetical protein